MAVALAGSKRTESIPSWILFWQTSGSPPLRIATPARPLQVISLSSMTPLPWSHTRTPTPFASRTALCST